MRFFCRFSPFCSGEKIWEKQLRSKKSAISRRQVWWHRTTPPFISASRSTRLPSGVWRTDTACVIWNSARRSVIAKTTSTNGWRRKRWTRGDPRGAKSLWQVGRRNSALTCYGRFFSAVAKKHKQRNTAVKRCYGRIRTLPIEREKVTEIEEEKEILSLFPLGFPPTWKSTKTVFETFVTVIL